MKGDDKDLSLHNACHSYCFWRPLRLTADGQDEPYRFFREFVGLNEDQIGTIRSGKALAKVVEATTPDEVFVFGAVYVKASPEKYLELASNIDALRKLPGYIAIQSFS